MSENQFQNIIDNRESLQSFRNYLQHQKSQSGIENLNFYLACTEMMKRSMSESPKSQLRSIKTIYRTYLKPLSNSPNSSMAVNCHTLKWTRHKIQSMGESTVDPLLFQRAMKEVFEYLKSRWFDEFNVVECKVTNFVPPNEVPANRLQVIEESHKQLRDDENGMKNFHQMLTERLALLKLPSEEENIDVFSSLAKKTSNDLLFKMIKHSASINIDVEKDALMALEAQYQKIGQFKPMETNNNNSATFCEFPGYRSEELCNSEIVPGHFQQSRYNDLHQKFDYCQRLILNNDCQCYKQ